MYPLLVAYEPPSQILGKLQYTRIITVTSSFLAAPLPYSARFTRHSQIRYVSGSHNPEGRSKVMPRSWPIDGDLIHTRQALDISKQVSGGPSQRLTYCPSSSLSKPVRHCVIRKTAARGLKARGCETSDTETNQHFHPVSSQKCWKSLEGPRH